MGAVFNSCTSDQKYNAGAVGAQGISKGGIQDIDDAALQTIKNGIGASSKAALKQTVQLSFALENLPNMDTFSKTDAFIILYQMKKQGSRSVKQRIGTTECIYDNLNPEFVTSFEVDYLFEETQTFLIEAYDMDDPDQANNLKAQEYIGSCEFQLHQVVTGVNQTLKQRIYNSTRAQSGTARITAEEKK